MGKAEKHSFGMWHIKRTDKPTELARSFLFYSCVCVRLYGPVNCISFHKFSRQLPAFSRCSAGHISAILVLSTTYLFMKVSPSPDVILCSSPHGLTFSWWGCYDLCLRYKPTGRAQSFYSVPVPISVFLPLSTAFHCMISPDNSQLSHSVLLVLCLPYWSFQLYVSL